MKLKRALVPFCLLLAPLAVCASPADGSFDKPKVTDRAGEANSQFTVSQSTQIPGHTLKPGSYSIRIVDRLSDRMILRVEKDGKTEATFLGLPSSGQSASGPIMLSAGAGAKSALKGFAFANGTVAEFVYPKDEAVGLAKANGARIAAIDPASEGRPANSGNLSQEDYQLVTLWLLSPTTVGPNAKAGILAQRYHAPDAVDSRLEASSQPTSAVVSTPPATMTQRTTSSVPANESASATVPVRPARQSKRVLATLPHTASEMPLVWLAGVLSLFGAAVLAGRRSLMRS